MLATAVTVSMAVVFSVLFLSSGKMDLRGTVSFAAAVVCWLAAAAESALVEYPYAVVADNTVVTGVQRVGQVGLPFLCLGVTIILLVAGWWATTEHARKEMSQR